MLSSTKIEDSNWSDKVGKLEEGVKDLAPDK